MVEKCLFCVFRAPGELDGHEGDAAGRNGVQCEVSGHDFSRPAERRRHGGSCHQEDCYHGQSPKYIVLLPGEGMHCEVLLQINFHYLAIMLQPLCYIQYDILLN